MTADFLTSLNNHLFYSFSMILILFYYSIIPVGIYVKYKCEELEGRAGRGTPLKFAKHVMSNSIKFIRILAIVNFSNL